MKKIGQLLLVLLGVFMLTGCGKLTTYRSISYNKYKEMIENKESFILFIGSSTCSACALYEKYLNAVITDYHVEVNYLDVTTLSDEEYSDFTSVINYGESTPTTVFIKDGQEKNTYNRIKGAQDYDAIVESFKQNGYIK